MGCPLKLAYPNRRFSRHLVKQVGLPTGTKNLSLRLAEARFNQRNPMEIVRLKFSANPRDGITMA